MRDCRVDAGCEGADLMTDEERIETAKRACKRNEYAREHGVCVRCHKSFLVNLAKIRGIDRELMTFVMEDGRHVHIHRQGFFAAKRAYEQYLFSIADGWKET